ncbi:hypothetical protein PHAVU_003G106302 [Phaseolus vulgaris]
MLPIWMTPTTPTVTPSPTTSPSSTIMPPSPSKNPPSAHLALSSDRLRCLVGMAECLVKGGSERCRCGAEDHFVAVAREEEPSWTEVKELAVSRRQFLS